jgi:hypothetical protein
MQGGCENFLSGASDHCTSTRRERRRKIFCKADAGDFLNIVLNYYKHPVALLIDETLERRRGKKIKAKGYYRDAVRSSQSQVVNAMGLKWLVMAISMKSPLMKRALALPFFSVLEPSKKCDAARKRQHKTSLRWTSQMILQVRRWVGIII